MSRTPSSFTTFCTLKRISWMVLSCCWLNCSVVSSMCGISSSLIMNTCWRSIGRVMRDGFALRKGHRKLWIYRCRPCELHLQHVETCVLASSHLQPKRSISANRFFVQHLIKLIIKRRNGCLHTFQQFELNWVESTCRLSFGSVENICSIRTAMNSTCNYLSNRNSSIGPPETRTKIGYNFSLPVKINS